MSRSCRHIPEAAQPNAASGSLVEPPARNRHSAVTPAVWCLEFDVACFCYARLRLC
jgi:hypothetical protein